MGDFWSSRIFFLAIWWAGYFFPFFPLKLSITFVLHAIFSSDKRLQEIFFKITPPPPPPQELNGRPLIDCSVTCVLFLSSLYQCNTVFILLAFPMRCLFKGGFYFKITFLHKSLTSITMNYTLILCKTEKMFLL